MAAKRQEVETFPAGALVQRPLARHRVMLSRRVIAYYGLIRASRGLSPTYDFVDESLPPAVARGSPIYSAHLSHRAVSTLRNSSRSPFVNFVFVSFVKSPEARDSGNCSSFYTSDNVELGFAAIAEEDDAVAEAALVQSNPYFLIRTYS